MCGVMSEARCMDSLAEASAGLVRQVFKLLVHGLLIHNHLLTAPINTLHLLGLHDVYDVLLFAYHVLETWQHTLETRMQTRSFGSSKSFSSSYTSFQHVQFKQDTEHRQRKNLCLAVKQALSVIPSLSTSGHGARSSALSASRLC